MLPLRFHHGPLIVLTMRPPSRLRRTLTVALAIVQVAVPSFVALADATHRTGAVRVHIEDHTQRNCVPVHSDDCALCRFMSHLSALKAGAPTLLCTTSVHVAVRSVGVRTPALLARSQQRSRAPPVG